MSVNGGLYTSASAEWRTPQDLFDRCNARWGPFNLDAAATEANALCPFHCVATCNHDHSDDTPHYRYGCDGNGLEGVWRGRVWMNPPYGREIGNWVKRAYDCVDLGFAERVVCLLPARTDTRWWQDYVTRASEVHFLKGRVKFLDAQGKQQQSAPFPSAIVVFERPFA